MNKKKLKQQLISYKNAPGSAILALLVMLATLLTFLTLFFLIIYLLIKGVPYLSADLFSLHYTSDNVSLFPALINTIWMTVLALVIAVPLGIFAAIFLVEYGSWISFV